MLFKIESALLHLRQTKPLVLCLTNYVTMDFMAQIQSHVMSSQYDSLLKKANFKGNQQSLSRNSVK